MIRLLWSSPTLHWLNSYKRGKISVWICIMAGHSVINLTIHLRSSMSHQSDCPSVMDCGKSNELQTEKRNRDEGMGGKSDGHQRWLNIQVGGLLRVPQASLTVTRCRIPDSDRCRTKGTVVYCYVLSPPLSLFPSILCLPQRETSPFLLQSSKSAWLTGIWWQRKIPLRGGQVGLYSL